MLRQDEKALLEQAAQSLGMDVADYLRSVAMPHARAVLDQKRSL